MFGKTLSNHYCVDDWPDNFRPREKNATSAHKHTCQKQQILKQVQLDIIRKSFTLGLEMKCK